MHFIIGLVLLVVLGAVLGKIADAIDYATASPARKEEIDEMRAIHDLAQAFGEAESQRLKEQRRKDRGYTAKVAFVLIAIFGVAAIALTLADTSESGKAEQRRQAASDPIKAASEFYAALSAANGEAAVALVVPDKRGRGAFNAPDISQFYGTMKEPLRVISVRLTDADTVEVRYTYTMAKKKCDTTATVHTESSFRATLIKAIEAKC